MVLLAGVGAAVDDDEKLADEGDLGSSTYGPEAETLNGLVVLVGIIVVTLIVIALKKDNIIKLIKER